MIQPAHHDRQLARAVDELDADALRWAVDAARLVRHPVFSGMVFAGALVAAGLVVLGVSAFGVGDQFYVSLQMPYLVSGGFAALGLIVTGSMFASILGHRRDEAMADDELSGVLAELAVVVRNTTQARADEAGR